MPGMKSMLAGALVVLVVAGGTIGLLMSEWQEQIVRQAASPPAAVRAPEATDAPSSVEEAVQPGLVQPAYPNMVARPLFMSTRRLPEEASAEDEPESEPEPEEEPAPEPDPVEARLRSVIITPSGRFAWLQPEGKERQVRLAPGDELDGWTLEAIEETHVQFKAGDVGMRLELRPSRSVGDPSEPVRPRPRAREADR